MSSGRSRHGVVEVETIFGGEAFQHLHVIGAGRVRLRPRHDRALLERQRLVGDDQLGIEQQFLAKPVARGAGALRGVEGEQPRFDLGNGEAGDRAGEFLGEDDAAGGALSASTARPAASSSSEGTTKAVRASLTDPSPLKGRGRRYPQDPHRPARRPASARSRNCPPAASRSPAAPPAGRPRPRCRACISCRAPARRRSRKIRRRSAPG